MTLGLFTNMAMTGTLETYLQICPWIRFPPDPFDPAPLLLIRIPSGGIEFPTQLTFEGYTGSNYVGNLDKRKSTSCCIFTYGGDAIPWRSKLQECTALSTTELEYMVASEATKETIWLYRLTANFSTTSRIDQPVLTILCDSLSVIHLIYNPVYDAKKKHIEVQYHHIRELVTEKKLEIRKIDTEVNIVDCLTMPL